MQLSIFKERKNFRISVLFVSIMIYIKTIVLNDIIK